MQVPLIRPLSHSGRAFSCGKRSISSKPNSTVSESAKEHLNWPDYLAIRRNRRKWQTAVTIPCALLGLVGGAAYFASLETDATKPIMGIDPFFFYGVCTMGCVGTGYLVGPTIGSALWRLTHRRNIHLIEIREREFYRRIAHHRVDASLQSPTAPVPDYYGEKIGSLSQYRQWLRDQAKYKKKATLPEE